MAVDDARLLNRRRVASLATFEPRSANLLVIVEAIVLPVDLESIRTGSLYHTEKLQTIQIISRPNIYLCRIQGMIYRIPTLIQRNLIQITNVRKELYR